MATAIGGKWQINDLRKQPHALKKHGFDEHCVWTGTEKGHPETKLRYWGGHILTNGKRSKVEYGPDTINEFLIDFVRRRRDGPFLVYYPMLLAHGPHLPTPFNKAKPPEGKHALFAGNVTYMDHLVGRLVKAVDDMGIADNTVIIFTADNGSAVAGTLDGRPYPKGKGRRADWGVHVPFVVRAPSISKRPRVSKDLVDFTDLFPTFAQLAGAKLPPNLKVDGVSLLPSLSENEDAFKKRNWIYSQIGAFRMVRDWQFLLDNQGGCYRISDDPRQTKNLFKSKERIIPGRRGRLKLILDRFPPNAKPPFKEFVRTKEKERRDRKQSQNRGSEKRK